MQLQSDRLILQPALPALARADIEDRERFAQLLDAEIPESWPPEFYDDDARRWVLALGSDGSHTYSYYLLVKQDVAKPVLTGTGGFKGPPRHGEVEIGYSIVPEWQRKGLGTEFVQTLIRHAFERLGAESVCAHTLPELFASRRVLEKNGFTQRGTPAEEGAIRYELSRAEWLRAQTSASTADAATAPASD